MAVRITVPAVDDVAEVVEALLVAADACEDRAPQLAARRRALADRIGDGLDRLPRPGAPCPLPGDPPTPAPTVAAGDPDDFPEVQRRPAAA